MSEEGGRERGGREEGREGERREGGEGRERGGKEGGREEGRRMQQEKEERRKIKQRKTKSYTHTPNTLGLTCNHSPPMGMIPLMCGDREVIIGWAELGCWTVGLITNVCGELTELKL